MRTLIQAVITIRYKIMTMKKKIAPIIRTCYGASMLKILLCLSIITASQSVDSGELPSCVCGTISERPNIWNKAETARWMVHNIDWGVLTTISSRTSETTSTTIVPFGNVYSFVDGSCTNSSGIPYFYGTYMDQSLQDMTHNPTASFTLSEASIDSSCLSSSSSSPSTNNSNNVNPIRQACRIVPETYHTTTPHHHETSTVNSGDPESPICARLTLTGVLEVVPRYSTEYNTTLFHGFHTRHPQMSHWPVDHHWIVFKLNIHDVWLINYFGGASVLTPQEYFQYSDLGTTTSVAAHDPV